ncbi:MAG: hypothetical protein A2504_07400 [Bdellovibrionales bacterium RIFOXYD12_FULL_39_22]|nr:MAG: hypothetical protein A2385_16770 [Bdellovibrionales bacterium RIFOXYB1_FULL_39_21]OFZ44703.1 MAG: hypothetical protein A2485_14630 [Bdellovibrionales bacterium RIFOXYC12_FULL_39_17]OFZ49333.1 MAG: hypothetical protein A2404_08925 [Bdellovibrionales bacterium RIFOXYC1_FULL_39_130]OFZ77069.1 MAG: hypothetical protein A2560_09890 [Bdellovibrionales bacterium RIFOXYD1_FULL_39_84]OFZ95329.1 MAG: hypothetical protein A2504_07400 [Bdellovibrionales bacterium RIFOXYD12_FULL_39_22]HLE13054.1 hy
MTTKRPLLLSPLLFLPLIMLQLTAFLSCGNGKANKQDKAQNHSPIKNETELRCQNSDEECRSNIAVILNGKSNIFCTGILVDYSMVMANGRCLQSVVGRNFSSVAVYLREYGPLSQTVKRSISKIEYIENANGDSFAQITLDASVSSTPTPIMTPQTQRFRLAKLFIAKLDTSKNVQLSSLNCSIDPITSSSGVRDNNPIFSPHFAISGEECNVGNVPAGTPVVIEERLIGFIRNTRETGPQSNKLIVQNIFCINSPIECSIDDNDDDDNPLPSTVTAEQIESFIKDSVKLKEMILSWKKRNGEKYFTWKLQLLNTNYSEKMFFSALPECVEDSPSLTGRFVSFPWIFRLPTYGSINVTLPLWSVNISIDNAGKLFMNTTPITRTASDTFIFKPSQLSRKGHTPVTIKTNPIINVDAQSFEKIEIERLNKCPSEEEDPWGE